MALVVEQDATLDPGDLGLFGAEGVVFQANGFVDLVQGSLGAPFCSHLTLLASLLLVVECDTRLLAITFHCASQLTYRDFRCRLSCR